MSIDTATLENDIVVDMAIDRTKRIWSSSAIQGAIKNALLELQTRGFFELDFNVGDNTIFVLEGVNKYSLDSNFPGYEDTKQIRFNDTPLHPISSETTINMGSDAEGVPNSYYFEGGNLVLYPKPSVEGELRVVYNRILEVCEDKICIDNNKYHDFLMYYASYILFLGKSDVQNQQRAAAKKLLWEPIIRRIVIAYGMPDKRMTLKTTSTYNPRLYSNRRR